MTNLPNTIATLLMIAKSNSENWREKAETAIHAYLANYQDIYSARAELLAAFTKENLDTERSCAIEKMIMLP